MYLHYLVKREMLIAHVLPLSCYRKKIQNLSHLNCGLEVRRIWIQMITECGKYCKRRCTKHAPLLWSYQRRYWWMASAPSFRPNWPNWPTLFSVAVSVRPDQWHVFVHLLITIAWLL